MFMDSAEIETGANNLKYVPHNLSSPGTLLTDKEEATGLRPESVKH
jgi:hypothetical protein